VKAGRKEAAGRGRGEEKKNAGALRRLPMSPNLHSHASVILRKNSAEGREGKKEERKGGEKRKKGGERDCSLAYSIRSLGRGPFSHRREKKEERKKGEKKGDEISRLPARLNSSQDCEFFSSR